MSTFKLKPEKIKNRTEIKTLDETHKKIMLHFMKRKKILPKKKDKLINLKRKLSQLENISNSECTNENIRDKSKIKSDIKILEEDINDIENNVSEMEYYSKTNDVLMDYYELIDNEEDNIYKNHPELADAKDNTDSNENEA